MSFMSAQYHCCSNPCGDATIANQDAVLAAIAALALVVDEIPTTSGGGTASETKQDQILDEIGKLTGGLRTI